MKVRDATLSDIPVIAAYGRQFFEEACWSDVAEWDDVSIRQTLAHMIASDDGIVLVLDRDGETVGIAGGLVHPMYFNFSHKTGQELFWWVKPDLRGGAGLMLLNALEAAARKRGAQSWAMICLDKVMPDRIGALYRKRGYRASEHSYIKRLA